MSHFRRFRRTPGPPRPLAGACPSSYYRIWRETRQLGLQPDQVGTVLAAKPYELPHACVSQWLNSGVPAPEVARRADHSVEVLLNIYVKCIHGLKEEMNERLVKGLGEATAPGLKLHHR